MTNIYKLFTLATLVILVSSCAGVRGKDTFYKSNERFAPYPREEMKIYWKDHGSPVDVNSYTFIATIKAQSFWAGIRAGKYNEEVHEYIIQQAADVGANAVIMYCPPPGTVNQETCEGDAIRFK